MRRMLKFGVVVALAVFGGGGLGAARGDDGACKVPRLTVRGQAVLNVPADQMHLDIGVVTGGDTAEAALQKNSADMRRVEEAIKAVGITADEYRTGRFQVQPKWSPRPRNADEDWKPRIIGYSVTNTLQIKTKNLKVAGKLIESCAAAGANDIGAIAFDLAEPRSHRSRAIEQATANANADARTLAKAAGVTLAKTLFIVLDGAAERPQERLGHEYTRAAMAAGDAAPVIMPGTVRVEASVGITFEVSEPPGGAR